METMDGMFQRLETDPDIVPFGDIIPLGDRCLGRVPPRSTLNTDNLLLRAERLLAVYIVIPTGVESACTQ